MGKVSPPRLPRRLQVFSIQFLLQDLDGNFSSNLEWLVSHGDPNIIRHPTVVLFADILWHRVASFKFVVSKLFSVFILAVFIVGQAALLRHTRPQTDSGQQSPVDVVCCRGWTAVLPNHIMSIVYCNKPSLGSLWTNIMERQPKGVFHVATRWFWGCLRHWPSGGWSPITSPKAIECSRNKQPQFKKRSRLQNGVAPWENHAKQGRCNHRARKTSCFKRATIEAKNW